MHNDIDIQKEISTLIKEGKNPSFRYHHNFDSLLDFSWPISQFITGTEDGSNAVKHIIYTLIKNYDYRLAALYMHAKSENKLKILDILKKIIDEKDTLKAAKLRYQLSYNLFRQDLNEIKRPDIHFIASLNDNYIRSHKKIIIYLRDPLLKPPLLALLNDVGTNFGKFIEQQYDLPNLNALVRQGVVRTLFMPNGIKVVSKSNNPNKLGQFQIEQRNYEHVINKLGGSAVGIVAHTSINEVVWLKIAQPFVVLYDGYSKQDYALSVFIEGDSLEDLLMNEHNSAIRNTYLLHYRLIIELLYDKGIIWGDMSARNIIVKRSAQSISYYIFDFEKTEIIAGPVPIEERIICCRGQICVEELATICSVEEVIACFNGYFDPTTWDFLSKAPLSFQPRAEIIDILSRRSESITLGAYNSLDYEIMNIREPVMDLISKRRIYLGHIGFKVEHYLSCYGSNQGKHYENKITDILIVTKNYKCFAHIIGTLTKLVDMLEYTFLKEAFLSILKGKKKTSHTKHITQVTNVLIKVIDSFYRLRTQESAIDNYLSHALPTLINKVNHEIICTPFKNANSTP